VWDLLHAGQVLEEFKKAPAEEGKAAVFLWGKSKTWLDTSKESNALASEVSRFSESAVAASVSGDANLRNGIRSSNNNNNNNNNNNSSSDHRLPTGRRSTNATDGVVPVLLKLLKELSDAEGIPVPEAQLNRFFASSDGQAALDHALLMATGEVESDEEKELCDFCTRYGKACCMRCLLGKV